MTAQNKPRSVGQASANSTGAVGRILIVDDNADAATSLGRLLCLMGHETLVVNDGVAAIQEVRHFRPAVVLLDLGMPGMDGLETAELIRKEPQGRDLALVAVTGWGQERDRERTSAAGFVAHLTKPVNMDQLERTLERILNSR